MATKKTSRQVSTAEARRDWARVLRTAERGSAVEVTRNGQPVAALVSIAQYRALQQTAGGTLADVLRALRAQIVPADLAGPDPFADVRDPSPGRKVDLG